MKRLCLAAFLSFLALPAFACPSPVTGKDAAGATQNFGVTLDGSANCYGNVGIVDGSNAANKATVTSENALKVAPTDHVATGTVTAVNNAVTVSTVGTGNVSVLISADTNVTLAFEGTVEGTTWFSISAYPINGGASVTSTATTGQWTIPAGGFNQVRLRVTAVGATPTATIFLNSGAGSTQPNVVVNPTAANLNATVTGTITANQGGAPWSENITQFGGTNISTGTGNGGAGIPRVTVSQDSNVKPWDGTNTETVKAASTNAATTDTAVVMAPSPNPSTVCTSIKPISQTASTDLITSTNKLHVCAVLIISATAQSVSLVEGTGSTCGTGTAALMGATTAANGMALAANGGFSHTASRAFMVTQTTADHLCLLQSGAGNVSGFISYVDHN